MPNKYHRNMHGENFSHPPVKEPAHGGAPSAGASPLKTANWPGLPGKSQDKDRSAGQPKRGWKGEFYVLSRMSPERRMHVIPPEERMVDEMGKRGMNSMGGMRVGGDDTVGASPVDRRGPKFGVPPKRKEY